MQVPAHQPIDEFCFARFWSLVARTDMCAYRPRTARKCTADSPVSTLLLFSADISQGWRIVRRVSLDKGKRSVIEGRWREVTDDLGNHLGYQIISTNSVDSEMPTRQTPATISASEMTLYAGQAFSRGRSRTAGMTEDQRLSRAKLPNGRQLPPEDTIERLVGKVNAYTAPASRVNLKGDPVYGDKAVRVYPKG